MGDADIRRLTQAIEDYAKWAEGNSKTTSYPRILMDFLVYAINSEMVWKDMFTVDTLEAFRSHSSFTAAPHALISLSDYLFSQNRIDQPLEIPAPQVFKQVVQLPDLYEQYLLFYKQTSRISDNHLKSVRSLLAHFHAHLQNQNIEISALRIEHLDVFLGGMKLASNTKSVCRSQLRGFLKYLYHDRKIIKRDLADLLVGPPIYAKPKPPKFLRPNELQKLFASLSLSTPRSIRTYAIVHLAYTMALRPVEISRIILNDISFSEKTLTMPDRKGDRPITLPIPEKAMKASIPPLSVLPVPPLRRHPHHGHPLRSPLQRFC